MRNSSSTPTARREQPMTETHSGCVLAIVGSRDVPDYQSSSLVKQAILEHKPKLVVSGGAHGVDTIAVVVARELGIPTIEFIPELSTWDAHGILLEASEIFDENGAQIKIPGGFKQRNMKVAEMCDCLVRISSATTKTYGSGWTADYAERLGKRVHRHTV